MLIDVSTVVTIRVDSPDQNKAENTVLTLLENYMRDALDCPAVVEAGIVLSPENPVSVVVKEAGE